MSPAPTDLIGFLAPYPQQVQALALEGRQELLDLLAPVTELHYDATSAVCAGFCYTDNARDNFVNLAVYANHVTLVFAWGVHLADPDGLLKGSGHQVRHLRLMGIETLRDPGVVDLIRQAANNATRMSGEFKPATIVKVYSGPKRRPTPQA